MAARREVEIEASPEEVWDALSTEEGRREWLEDDPDRRVLVEEADAPSRLVWWWWSGDDAPPSRVEIRVDAVAAGSRVVVTETVPTLPLTRLRASLRAVRA